MSSDPADIEAPEINYDQLKRAHGAYTNKRIYQQNGGETLILGVGDRAQSIFELPPSQVINFKNSYIKFQATILDSGDGVYNRLIKNGDIWLDSVSLQTQGGTGLVQLNEAAKYSCIVSPVLTSHNDFFNRDAVAPPAAYALGNAINYQNDINPVKDQAALSNQEFVTGANPYVLTTGTPANVGYPPEPLYDIQQYYTGAVGDGAVAGQLVVNVKLFLGQIVPDSMLSMMKDWYFGETLYLYLNFTPASQIYYTGTDAAVLNTGIAFGTQPITLTSYSLWIACDPTAGIAQSLAARKNSGEGYQVIIPYPYLQKTSLPALQTNANQQLRLNSTFGFSLLRVYTTFFPESAPGVYLFHGNQGQTLVQTIFTELDNNRLQEQQMDDRFNQPLDAIQQRLEGCVLGRGNGMHKRNWVYFDDFTNLKSCDWLANNFIEDGIPLIAGTAERNYSVSCTTPPYGGESLYNYYITQRIVVINKSGTTLI